MENRVYTISEDVIASQGQRFGNFIIDFVARLIITFIVGMLLAILAQLTEQPGITDWLTNMGRITEYLVDFAFMLIYYIIMETLFSRSIGKYITKTIVVMEDGSKPDAATIIKRSFCRYIPFDGLSFFGTPSRGWHDSISNTYVVRKEDFEREKELFYSFEQIGNSEN